ncbi:MAG: hypothetical protein QXL18_05550 [Candidatus Woesearchaeota archaeon]
MNGKDMVFSYINLKDNNIFTKICSDPIKVYDDVLILYNTKNYTNEEVIDWVEKIRKLFKINFEYDIVDNTLDKYIEIIDNFTNQKIDRIVLKNNYKNLVENSDGNILYFYFENIHPSVKYLLFVILRYGICSSFKTLKEIIIYLYEVRKLSLWESIFFSHFDKSLSCSKKIYNSNNPVITENLSYFQFLDNKKNAVFFDLNKILDSNYLNGTKLLSVFSKTRMGSYIFSNNINSNAKTISFKDVDDNKLKRFINSFQYKNKLTNVLRKLSINELEIIEDIYKRIKQDKFDIFRNHEIYYNLIKNNYNLEFFIEHSPEYCVKDLNFYYNNFFIPEALDNINTDKSYNFISKYTEKLKHFSDFDKYITTHNYVKTLFTYENFVKIYESIIKNYYEKRCKNNLVRI